MKPATEVEYVDAEARPRTIAVFTKMKRQQLEDSEAVSAAVRSTLGHKVLRRLEAQVLAGDGVGESLRGIINTSGVASVPYAAGPGADLILEGALDAEVADLNPTGVAIHPQDHNKMLTDKTQGSGEYFSGGPFQATLASLWGLPAVRSRALALGAPVVGDWERAAIFVREGLNIRVSDSDQDDLTRNRVTIFAEGRFTLAVWQPSGFSVVDLTAFKNFSE